ncbi:hypothetical protein GCM10027347_61460 [Larkinella harenae]
MKTRRSATDIIKRPIKDRVEILIDHFAADGTGDPEFDKYLLNDEEVALIEKSLETTRGRALYDQTFWARTQIWVSLLAIKQLHYAYREAVAYITGYAMLWESYQETENLLNNVLREVGPPKSKAIAKMIQESENLLFVEVGEKSGESEQIEIVTDRKTPAVTRPLETVILEWRRRAEMIVVQLRDASLQLIDTMSTYDTWPKPYLKVFERILRAIEDTEGFMPKYTKWRSGLSEEQVRFAIYPDTSQLLVDDDLYEMIKNRKALIGEL